MTSPEIAQGRLDGDDADTWNDIIGPVYDRAGLERAFGFTGEQIDEMVEANAILELVTTDGTAIYPANCFDDAGQPPPHLAGIITKLLARELIEPWSIAIWLNAKPEEWDGRSAIELLRTEWADEVVTQVGEGGRSPLGARAWQVEKMAIARLILNRFVELVAGLPVEVAEGTLFVTRETKVPHGVFAMSLGEGPKGMRRVRFRIDGNVEQRATDLAGLVTAQIAGTANEMFGT